jgi:hypothetical protein
MSIEQMKTIAGYDKLAKFLTENGYPTGKQTVYKLCARGEGPPHGQWGTRYIFSPIEVLAWARNRALGAKSTAITPAPVASSSTEEATPIT